MPDFDQVEVSENINQLLHHKETKKETNVRVQKWEI